MKVLLLSLMLFILGVDPIITENNKEFDTEINNAYNTYYVMKEENTDNYGYTVVIGEVKDEVTYSILFTSVNPKNYELVLRFKGDNVVYKGGVNERGDTFIYGIMPNSQLDLVIRTRESETASYTIEPVSLDSYNKLYLSSSVKGIGNGLNKTNVKALGVKSVTFILSIVFASIIVISIIVIIILALTKKGIFSKQKVEDVNEEMTYEDLIKKTMDEVIRNQNMNNPNNPYNNQNPYSNPNNINNPIEVEATEVKEEEPTKEVYEKVRDYDLEETKDVKSMLEKNGFNTDYKNMTSDDKNKVMLELMRMKDFKEISENDYRSEVIKLWM